MFEREKLFGSNFNDWFRSPKMVLRVEKKLFVIEQPIPPASPADSKSLRSGMRFMMLIMRLLVLFSEKAKKKSLNAKGKGKGKGKGKDKSYIPKPKNPKPYAKEHPAKDDACHHCKEVGHCKRNCPPYLAKLIKKKKQVDTASSSDRGGEYISQEFKDYLKACGIVQQLTPPYIPQHNRVSERRNRTLLDMVQLMMNLTTLSLSFWDYALETASRILNMVPTKKVEKTPYELWYGKVPNLSYLKVWGCETLMKRDTPDKLQQRSVKCIFIGYPKETMGYYFYFPPENKIVVARYAEFLEENLLSQEVSGKAEELEKIQEKHSLGDLNEPTNYKAAILDPESDKWLAAMNAEMQSMKDNQVWRLVDLPPNCKTVGSKWLFKKKTNMDGIVHTYKARLVAKGYTQTYGVDYEETFSPVADIRAIMILIDIAAFYDYEIWQMDVKTAFLSGYLDEDIYVVFKMDNSKRGNISMQERFDLNKIQGASTPEEVKHMQNVPYASAVVHTDDNLADPFTKALPKGKPTQHARSMGLRLASSFMLICV
ncbi:retrovirus-related pol polyprotein from transposon TNT 1-94 [Tanacetum coccineum]